MSDTPRPSHWTTCTVARALRLSEHRVRQLADAGQLPSTRTESGVRLFLAADVRRFVRARNRKATEGSTSDVSRRACATRDVTPAPGPALDDEAPPVGGAA
jgi:DNA-binding transcriptional MerR regulator